MSKAAELAALIGSQTALSNRNLIINGAMNVAQRGTSSSVSNGSNEGYQTLDRWQFHYYNNADGEATISQDTDVPSGQGFSNSYKVDVTTADASIASTHMISFSQRIEARDIRNSGWNYTSSSSFLTLSFYIKSTKTGTYCISANLPDVGTTFKFIKEFTISSASTWEYKTIKIPGNASAVIDNDKGRGMDLEIVLQTGADANNATDNTWHTADISRSTANQVSFFDSTSNVLNITGVQLEVGEQATAFEHRSFADELARCQRYYQVTGEATSNYHVFPAQRFSSTKVFFSVPIATSMRSDPTLGSTTTGNIGYVAGNGQSGNFALSAVTFVNLDASSITVNVTVGYTPDNTRGYTGYITTGDELQFDAEL
jgi:hypothetical protein